MSDFEHSTITYTSVSIPVEDDSDIGSPGVDGPPIMPEDPYAYIMAAYEVPPSPDYIPGLEEDEILPAEEHPLPTTAASPTADSPGYVPESDPEEEPEEDDEDPGEDPADYPTDGDDDDDDKDEDEDEEEEEEHPAPANSVPPVHRMTARISIRDEPSISLPPREEVERLLALTTPPPSLLTPLSSPLPQIPLPPPNSPTHIEIPKSCLPLRKRVRFASPTPSREVGESSAAGAARQDRPTIARDDPYSIAREDLYGFVNIVDVPPRCSTSRELDYDIMDTWDDLVGAIDDLIVTLLALTTPPPSPLTPLSSPLPLPTSSPPLQLLSSDHRTDRPEITLPPRKRLGVDLGPRYEIGESSAAAATRPIGGRRADYGFVGTIDTEIRRQRAEEVGYRIRDVWVDPREAVEEVTPMTLEGVNARVIELTAVQEQDTQDIYAVIEDTQDKQTQIYQSVETLFDDSQYHYETARLLDQEALVSREAWGRSIEVSYMTRSEIMALRSIVMGQQAVISQLQAADRRSQVMTSEMLQADHQRQVQLTKALKLLKGLQTQMLEFQRQHGPAKGPAQPDATKGRLVEQFLRFGYVPTVSKNLALKCVSDVSKRNSQVKNYVGGLARTIIGRVVMALSQKLCRIAIEFALNSWTRRSTLGNPPNVNTGANQRVFFECGAQGHFKKDCPKLTNNNNRGNRVGNAKAQAKVYAVGNAGANPDNNVVTGSSIYSKIDVGGQGITVESSKKNTFPRLLSGLDTVTLNSKSCAPILAFTEGSEDSSILQMLTRRVLWALVVDAKRTMKANVVADALSRKANVVADALSRWLELLSDYDCEIRYHPRKANVTDARKPGARTLKRRMLEELGTTIVMATWFPDLEETIAGGPIMKANIATNVSKCLTVLNYHASIKCAPFEALYGRKCRLTRVLAEDSNREIDKRATSTLKRKPNGVFKVGDKVSLRFSPWKGVYVLETGGEVITPDMSDLSRLLKKKCYSDDPLVVPLEGLQVDDKLHFVEEPVEIMDREVKQLRQSRVPIVKVRWNSRRGPEFTWEREDQFKNNIHTFSPRSHLRQVPCHKP
ncbi:putative reverse transcriptase domain-containing protein [Tanacetum coccineum]